MKKIIGIFIVISVPLLSFSQSKSLSELQKKFADDKSFVLNLSGSFMADAENSEFGDLVKKILSLKIVAVDKKSSGYSSSDLKRLKAEIRKKDMEEVVSVKSKDGNVKILIKDRNGKLRELVLLADSDDDGFVAIDFSSEED